MAEDFVQVAPDSTGAKIRTRQRVIGANTVEEQYVIVQDEKVVTYQGRMASFRTPGRAAVSQNLAAIHNATGSSVLVRVNRILIDLLSTAAGGKSPTIITPTLRVKRFTALPTNGTSLTKTPRDSSLSSNASITCWGDASADGTGSATTLTITAGATLAQAFAPRIMFTTGTAAATSNTPVMFYEPVDAVGFFTGEPDIILRPLEGLVVVADAAVVTTGNPATDFWSVVIDWDEYTLP